MAQKRLQREFLQQARAEGLSPAQTVGEQASSPKEQN